jgi:hypothetical protein
MGMEDLHLLPSPTYTPSIDSPGGVVLRGLVETIEALVVPALF